MAPLQPTSLPADTPGVTFGFAGKTPGLEGHRATQSAQTSASDPDEDADVNSQKG